MTWAEIIGLVLTLLVMVIGLAGTVLPGLPSTPIVLAAAIGHKLYFREESAGWWVIGILSGLTLLSALMDYLGTIYGARRLGATWRGMAGAVVGGIVGLFFGLPGILIGPFAGAVLFELAGGRQIKEASQAGVGALIGLLVGAVGKAACCVAMMGLFIISTVYRSLNG